MEVPFRTFQKIHLYIDYRSLKETYIRTFQNIYLQFFFTREVNIFEVQLYFFTIVM